MITQKKVQNVNQGCTTIIRRVITPTLEQIGYVVPPPGAPMEVRTVALLERPVNFPVNG